MGLRLKFSQWTLTKKNQRRGETARRLIMPSKQKIPTWLRKKTKRCTQHCFKTKFWALTTPFYFMKSTTVTRFFQNKTYTHNYRDSRILRTLHHSQVKMTGGRVFLAQADNHLTLHHSTRNSRCWNSTALPFLNTSLMLAMQILTIWWSADCSLMLQTIHSINRHQTSFRNHQISQVHHAFLKILILWSVVVLSNLTQSAALMKIKW